ncbi:MAG: hypothetical protein H6817_00925 [Phycisphaerales bacterium]|nr:hypothetical protein [Phycisphaerales bacterium]
MSTLILFEDRGFTGFLPLTYWRSVMSLRCGRKSLIDNASFALREHISGIWTRAELSQVSAIRCQIPANQPVQPGAILINGRWVLEHAVEFHPAPYVARCGDSIAYIACDEKLAKLLTPDLLLAIDATDRLKDFPTGDVDAKLVEFPWDLIERNAADLSRHWTGDDRGSTGNVSSSAFLLNPDHIHIGDRTRVRPTAVIDAGNGPVFISNDVRIDVHTYIEGPVYIGPGSVVKPHSSIRAGSSLGSLCKVAGEISQTIMSGYVNKQHEGFLGDAYVGSWVNMGAGTTNSNLKNTYGEVKVRMGNREIPTGRQFVGSVIGDFARTGIGQLLPTGAVIGFGAMVATGGLAPQCVPSFAWQTAGECARTNLAKLREVADRVMQRRKIEMTAEEQALFESMPGIVEQYGV